MAPATVPRGQGPRLLRREASSGDGGTLQRGCVCTKSGRGCGMESRIVFQSRNGKTTLLQA